MPHVFGRHIVGAREKRPSNGKPAAAMDAIQPVVNARDVLDRTVLAEGLLEKKTACCDIWTRGGRGKREWRSVNVALACAGRVLAITARRREEPSLRVRIQRCIPFWTSHVSALSDGDEPGVRFAAIKY